MNPTVKKIKATITAGIEDTGRADRAFAALSKFGGRLLSQPIADKIKAETGEERVYIRRQYGMTNLVFGGYGLDSSPDRGMSFLLAHSEKNVYIDLDYVVAQNTSYLQAAKDRNAQRALELAAEQEIAELAKAIDAFNAAHAVIKSKLAYGAAFGTSRIDLEKLLVVSL